MKKKTKTITKKIKKIEKKTFITQVYDQSLESPHNTNQYLLTKFKFEE